MNKSRQDFRSILVGRVEPHAPSTICINQSEALYRELGRSRHIHSSDVEGEVVVVTSTKSRQFSQVTSHLRTKENLKQHYLTGWRNGFNDVEINNVGNVVEWIEIHRLLTTKVRRAVVHLSTQEHWWQKE